MFNNNTLKGKSILVTGGGSGLGFAMANQFAQVGANVSICGRDEKKLSKAAGKLKTHGTKIIAHAVDVRDYSAVEDMIKRLVSEFDSLDGLVNNAAGNFLCPSEDLSPNAFKAVLDIVLTGTFNCTQNFGKYLISQKIKGSILNIVTTYRETGSSFVLPSACAKAGVQALTNTLAYEWATYGIRVNSIAPGPFPTEGAWTRLMSNAKFEKEYLNRIPVRRYGKHAELANLAVFLMSDMAPYINGECVTIDGGERLQAGQFNFITQMTSRDELKELFSKMRAKKTRP